MRFVIVALFMALASGVCAQEADGVSPEGPAVEEQPDRGASESDSDAIPYGIPVIILESPDEAAYRRDRNQKTDQQQSDDLDAQRRSADAAERSAATAEGQIIPTWIQAGVAILGTIALIVTVVYSIRASNAAVAANNITKELFATESRPWLRLGRPVIRINDDQSEISFRIKAFNIGKTPALSTEVYISVTSTEIPVPSVGAVENFASKFTATSAWRNNQKSFSRRKAARLPRRITA